LFIETLVDILERRVFGICLETVELGLIGHVAKLKAAQF
jgi:hypothetical protein